MKLPKEIRLSEFRQQFRYYAFALLTVALATLLREYLDPVLKNRFPYFLYYVALIACCWYGTLGSSLLCFGLGELAADWFFVDPRRTLGPSDMRSWEAFLTYIVVGGAIVIFAEAHRRAAARSELAQSRLQLALTAANAGIFDWDIESEQITCSDQYYDVLGQDRRITLTPQTWMQHLHPEDRERISSTVHEALASPPARNIRLDFQTLDVDGKQRWVHARWVLYRDPAGRAIRAVGVALDVSDLKQAELALVRTEKLASAGRFAATMAHEINNPLEAITNLVYIVQNQPSLEAARPFLQMADSELRWVSHVVQRTLSFYKEAKPPAPFEVTAVLDETVELISRKVRTKSVTVTREYAKQIPRLVGAAGEMRQVFLNLLANSIDAVGPNGTIRIHISSLRSDRSGQEWVRVSIADTGSGIRRSDLPRIFEPFFTTKPAAGTGLGLWLTKQIVERHGGRIRVRSSARPPRTWTVFSILLPVPAAAESQGATAGRESSAA